MIKSPPSFPALWVGQKPTGTGSVNVKFCANPIIEYISRRIGCQRFYDALGFRDQDSSSTWGIFG
jgi:hypothetical protein